jgi:AcrR family transcriptional regulator
MPRLSEARKELLTSMMKESIFEAATSVLSEHGLDGTTMNRVAAAADLAKSSLYDYFPSKDDLLEFVSDRLVAPVMQAVEETLHADLPAPQKLARIVGLAFENSTRHKAVVRLLVQSNQDYRVRQRTRPLVLDAFRTIFEQGIKEGSFRPHNTAHSSRMFLGAFRELFELQASSESEEAANEYCEALIGAALHGLSIHVGSAHANAHQGRPQEL